MSRQHVHPIAAAPLEALLQQKASCGETFTVCELRDRLSEQPGLADIDAVRLRAYVQEQINKREKYGVVEQVGRVEGKCRKVFRLTTAVSGGKDTSHDMAGDAYNATSLVAQLNHDSDALRARMEASDYRLQAFQEIAEKYPDALDEIAPLFEQEKAQARALGEKLKAYADVQRQLAQAGGDA